MRMRDLAPFEMCISKIWYNSNDSVRMRDLTPFEMWILKILYNSMIQCACAIWHPLKYEFQFRKSDIILWFSQCACTIWHPLKCEFQKSDMILICACAISKIWHHISMYFRQRSIFRQIFGRFPTDFRQIFKINVPFFDVPWVGMSTSAFRLDRLHM